MNKTNTLLLNAVIVTAVALFVSADVSASSVRERVQAIEGRGRTAGRATRGVTGASRQQPVSVETADMSAHTLLLNEHTESIKQIQADIAGLKDIVDALSKIAKNNSTAVNELGKAISQIASQVEVIKSVLRGK